MAYTAFAYYYDSLMDEEFYQTYLQFILQHASFHTVLELGCGTGTIAIMLAKEEKEVYATDLSEDMLEIARDKSLEEGVNLHFALVDMTDFSTNSPVDLILCLCDSLNYIKDEKQVREVFMHVYDALQDQGTFIFDVHSIYKINHIFKDYHEHEEDDEFYFDWLVKKVDEGRIEQHVVIRDYIEDEEVDEVHEQYVLSLDQYKKLLNEAGFTSINVYGDFTTYQEECERIIFVVRK